MGKTYRDDAKHTEHKKDKDKCVVCGQKGKLVDGVCVKCWERLGE